ncbi:MAG: hypothetical protein P9L90_05420 [Candidatus Aadella gelida]|nr:hypothetical protein [Candidatus Aadella gelida]
MNKKYNRQDIHYLLAGIYELDDSQLGWLMKSLAILDDQMIDKVTREVYFVASNHTLWAFYMRKNAFHLKQKRAIIFFSEQLFERKEEEIIHTILHEIAHHILKHKCLLDFSDSEMHLAEKLMEAQEKEADVLVRKWFKNSRS